MRGGPGEIWCEAPITADSPPWHCLQTRDIVARALMSEGILRTKTVINPINRCPTVIVPNEKVEKFELEYVPLFSLSKAARKPSPVKNAIKAASIKPAFDPKKVKASFYRRAEVEGIFTSLPEAAELTANSLSSPICPCYGAK